MAKEDFVKIWVSGCDSDIDCYSNLYFEQPKEIQGYEYCQSFMVFKNNPIGCIIEGCEISPENGYPENLDDFLREFYQKYP